MSPVFKGKVLKILDRYSVVINLGGRNGIKKNMKFIIYEEGDMIKDPVTNADIEKLELVKGEVTVTTVQQMISVAESFEIAKKVYNPLFVIRDYSQEYEVKERIALTKEKIEAPIISSIKVGDLVRSI